MGVNVVMVSPHRQWGRGRARHLERDAQRRDDEGKFADLRERKSAVRGFDAADARPRRRRRAEHHLTAQLTASVMTGTAPQWATKMPGSTIMPTETEDGTEKVLDRRDEVLEFRLRGFRREYCP